MKRYPETQAESAALLRLVLAHMAQHDAPFHPQTFAVWYEHLGGVNPRLSQALEHQLRIEPRLSDDSLRKLHAAHVADIDAAAMERASGGFQRAMQTMAEAASRTGDTAGSFNAQLSALGQALGAEHGGGPELALRMSDALASTQRMQAAVDALQQQVASSRGEIEKLRSDLERTREEALLCPLSKVLNRKGFDHRLKALLDPAGRTGTAVAQEGACLVMIDIDHFKKINDTHGHLVGDRVLEAMGEVLRTAVPDPGAATARFGGEEFAILLPGQRMNRAVELAEAVREGVKRIRVRQRSTEKIVLTVTVSAGVAGAPPGEDPAALIARADAALYRGKNAGRDRVVVA